MNDEVIRPTIVSGMKQPGQLPSFRIKARQIRTFLQVTAMTSKGEIVDRIIPAMLPRNDMLYVEWNNRLVRL